MRLPGFAFARDVALTDLVDDNPFIYRVHSFQSHCPLDDHGFTAPYYSEIEILPTDLSTIPITLKDVASRIDNWQLTSQSNGAMLISTTYNFVYALWEGLRRSQGEECVQISVIDVGAIAHHSMTSIEILRDAPQEFVNHWNGRHPFSSILNFANAQAEVVVAGHIPKNDVICTIVLTDLIPHLPLYYFGEEPIKGSPVLALQQHWLGQGETIRASHTLLLSAFQDVMRDNSSLTEAQHRRQMSIPVALRLLCGRVPKGGFGVGEEHKEFVELAGNLAYEIARYPSWGSLPECSGLTLEYTRSGVRQMLERKADTAL